VEFANQGLNKLLYKKNRMKKRERGEEDYQSDADDVKMQFFPVVYLLRYICEGLNVCVWGGDFLCIFLKLSSQM